MNITITQDNSRIETLGSNGASIILKLYDLAIDSNNTLTLRGNISSPSAYEEAVTYLNNTYGPDFTVSATKVYIRFEDANAQAVCAKYFGDGVGCTAALLATADIYSSTTIDNKTFGEAFRDCGAVTFNEFRYFTSVVGLRFKTVMFGGNSTITEITLPNSCIYLDGTWYTENNHSITVNNTQALTHVDMYGFETDALSSGDVAAGYILDFNKFYGAYNRNGYGRSPIAGCGNEYIIVPRSSILAQGSSTKFNFDKMVNTHTIVFREDFTCTELTIEASSSKPSSVTAAVFLSTQPPVSSISLNWGPNDVYVPNSATSNYSGVFDQYRTIHSLEDFANISDANKDILVEAGCTATGSTGNWTITPPTT